MLSIYNLKSSFQDLLRPAVKALHRKGATANQVTIAAMAISFATGIWLALMPDNRVAYLAYPIVLFMRMALNAIDGMLAREFDQKSDLGGFLNEIADVLSDAALYLSLGFLIDSSLLLASIFAILAVTTELTGLVAATLGASRRYDGPMGKSDRAFAIGALMFFAAFFPSLLIWTNLLLTTLSLLCIWTIANRIQQALKEIEKRK